MRKPNVSMTRPLQLRVTSQFAVAACLWVYLPFASALVAAVAFGASDAPCDPSVGRYCANGGTCGTFADGTRYCQCSNGWGGDNCSEDQDDCASQPCKNNGTCVDLKNRKFKCNCQNGFIGPLCEYKNPCQHNPCSEGATCSVKVPNWTTRVCTCPPGFFGSDCSQDVNECEHSRPPCANGAQCENLRGSYRCLCPAGFRGRDCSEQELPSCQVSSPCLNGGTCIWNSSGAKCVCNSGFYGFHCELARPADPCRAQPCRNSGRCVALGPNFTCDCLDGWAGDLCDTCAEGYCQNGGRCNIREGALQCDCPSGFTGPVCAKEIGIPPDPCAQDAGPRCRNGGTCFANSGGYGCYCSAGFQGRHCELPKARVIPTEVPRNQNFDPWADCPQQLRARCSAVFADGHCNPECATAGQDGSACLLDGFDCEKQLPACPKRSNCAADFSNDLCNPECNSTACLLDGGDCLPADAGDSKEILTLRVDADGRQEIEPKIRGFLRQLTSSLRAVLRIESVNDVVEGGRFVQLRLSIRSCLDHGACPSSPATAASLLAELLRRRLLRPVLPIAAVTGIATNPPPTPLPPDGGKLVAILVGLCCLLACALIAGVLYTVGRRRKIVTRGIWRPPGFQAGAGKGSTLSLSSSPTAGGTASVSGAPMDSMLVMQAGDKLSSGCGSVSCRLLQPPMRAPLTPQVSCKRAKYENTNFYTLNMPSGSSLATAPSTSSMATSHQYLHHASDQPMETPLHLAARYCRSDATRHLLESGADPNVPDMYGRTALHAAIASGAHGVAHLLMSHRGTDLNAKAEDFSTPLIVAAKYGELEIAASLVAFPQVDTGSADLNGKTALHWAAAVNAGDLVSLLLCHGANKDPADSQERTPLFLAAYEGSADAAARLIDAGANRDACDASGRTPRQAAEARLHMDIVQMLLRCGHPSQPQPPPLQPPVPQQQLLPPLTDPCNSLNAYPPHHYPTPPSNTEMDDSPPLQQPMHYPAVAIGSSAPMTTVGHQQHLHHMHHQLQQQQQQLRPVTFLTPSPESAQGSPIHSLAHPASSSALYANSQLPDQTMSGICGCSGGGSGCFNYVQQPSSMLPHVCYGGAGQSSASCCYPPHQREAV